MIFEAAPQVLQNAIILLAKYKLKRILPIINGY